MLNKKYILLTDTNTDLTYKQAKKYGYELISMPYVIDGKDYFPYSHKKTFNFHEYYEMLREGTMPTTYALSPDYYISILEPLFKTGKDILYIHFSAEMSSTFNNLTLAIKELNKTYKNKFVMIDTKNITLGALHTVVSIGKLYKKGYTIDQIQSWASQNILKTATYFYADNLKFFGRSGRVSGWKAFWGNIFAMHPIIYVDSTGKMVTEKAVRGKKFAIKELLSKLEQLGDNVEKHIIVIAHSDAPTLAKLVEERIKEMYPKKKLQIVRSVTNPTIGSHCGPDCVGIAFHAIHR